MGDDDVNIGGKVYKEQSVWMADGIYVLFWVRGMNR